MSDLATALLITLVEFLAYAAGKLVGRPLHVDTERAYRIGQWLVAGVLIGTGLLLTFLYS